jgi:hypothetical protein
MAGTRRTRSSCSKITLVVSIVSLPEALLFESFKARPQPFRSLVVSSQFHVEESNPSLALNEKAHFKLSSPTML